MSAKRNPDMDNVVLAQVALNTNDMPGTLRLYSELFGFLDGGGHGSWGGVAKVQGLQPNAYWLTWWMVGAREFFQLEVFQHQEPKQKPQPKDWRPSDEGWVRFGMAVSDFDRVTAGLQRFSIPVLGTSGAAGKRRLAFRDPHVGCIVEVMEGAAPACPTAVYAAASVPDLAKARWRYEDVLGAEILPLEHLHKPEDEALWGLAGAEREGFLVRLGDCYLEIVCYKKPASRPRPADYWITDQGIMNIGLGTRDVPAVQKLIKRVQDANLKITLPVVMKDSAGTYVVEPNFEVELMGVPASMDKKIGFVSIGKFAPSVKLD
jgi:catechol 2,3-dioxygenase-like lactoylglutathione lyase family enzyme